MASQPASHWSSPPPHRSTMFPRLDTMEDCARGQIRSSTGVTETTAWTMAAPFHLAMVRALRMYFGASQFSMQPIVVRHLWSSFNFNSSIPFGGGIIYHRGHIDLGKGKAVVVGWWWGCALGSRKDNCYTLYYYCLPFTGWERNQWTTITHWTGFKVTAMMVMVAVWAVLSAVSIQIQRISHFNLSFCTLTS